MKYFWLWNQIILVNRIRFKFYQRKETIRIAKFKTVETRNERVFFVAVERNENASFILFTGIGFIVSTFERGRITAFDTVSFRNSYFWCSTARLSPRRRTMKRSVDLVRLVFVCLLRKRARYAPLTHPLGRDPNLSNRNGSMLGLFLFRISSPISHRDRETLETGSA